MARIGLLSDSHGRARTTQTAVDLLLKAGVTHLIHLGDVGTIEVLDALVSVPEGGTQPLPVGVVFGNVDWDTAGLGSYAADLGIDVAHPVGRWEIEDAVIMFMHGHDEDAMEAALAAQPTYLCHGHSHAKRDQRRGPTRIINPGALFRAHQYTTAWLDTASDGLTFIDVPA